MEPLIAVVLVGIASSISIISAIYVYLKERKLEKEAEKESLDKAGHVIS